MASLQVARIGDSYITSGYAMGFGYGDFGFGKRNSAPPQHRASLDARLVGNVTNTTATDPRNWLYMSTGIVARRPAGPEAAMQRRVERQPP